MKALSKVSKLLWKKCWDSLSSLTKNLTPLSLKLRAKLILDLWPPLLMTPIRYPWRQRTCLSGGRFNNRKIHGRRFHHQGQPFQQGRSTFKVSTSLGPNVGSKNISLLFSHGQSGIKSSKTSPLDRSFFSRKNRSNVTCGLWRVSKNATWGVTDTSALSRFETTKAKNSNAPSRIWSFWKEMKNKDTLKPLRCQTILLARLKQLWDKFILPSLCWKVERLRSTAAHSVS